MWKPKVPGTPSELTTVLLYKHLRSGWCYRRPARNNFKNGRALTFGKVPFSEESLGEAPDAAVGWYWTLAALAHAKDVIGLQAPLNTLGSENNDIAHW